MNRTHIIAEGQATFKELIGDLDLPYRRAADVVNGKNELYFRDKLITFE